MRAASLLSALLLAACLPPTSSSGPTPVPGTPLEQKLADNPNDATINFELGQTSESQGDYLRAEQYYLRAEALGRKDVLPALLRVLVTSRRYGEALARCQRRLSVHPEDRTTRYVKSALLVALDRVPDAERELETLIHTKPDDPRAYLELGRLKRDLGLARPARALYQQFLERVAVVDPGADTSAVRFELAEDPRLAAPDDVAAPAPAGKESKP